MKKAHFLLCLPLIICSASISAQAITDSPAPDSSASLVGGATAGASVGGYIELNANRWTASETDERFSFQMQRVNIYIASTLLPRLRFLTEIEFEEGGREIALEIAMLDYEFHRAISARAGILLAPLGRFNPGHDGPLWEFVERPMASTLIIPTTHTELAFGMHGLFPVGSLSLGYEVYLANGLGDGIIRNDAGRTSIPEGKSVELFSRDNNGLPAYMARISVAREETWDVGVSFYTGVYNSFRRKGEVADKQRSVAMGVFDFGAKILGIGIQGEMVYAGIDVPASLPETYARKQWGGFVELLCPVMKPQIAALPDAVINVALRLDYADLNAGTFSSNGERIFDDAHGITAALSFRPSPASVLRLNYLVQRLRDPQGAYSDKRGLHLGFSTYF